VEETPALSSPSCAVLYDGDNDGDVDVALTDEIADVVKIMQNGNGTSLCPPLRRPAARPSRARAACRSRTTATNPKDRLQWKWGKGQATPKSDYGDPTMNGGEDYELCVYKNNSLIMNRRIPAGGICAGKACWQEKTTRFGYKGQRTDAGRRRVDEAQ
jgi:hypothetical protein